jgi:hypothetical protein
MSDCGLVAVIVVGSIGETEAAATVEPEEARARGARTSVGRGALCVRPIPAVEPADPELCAHQRPGLLVSAQRGKALAHPATDVRRAQHSRQPAVADGVVCLVGVNRGTSTP